MQYLQIIQRLKQLSSQRNFAGMEKFGIKGKNKFGVSMPNIRSIAKQIGKDHILALKLWKSGIHEARILACLIDEIDKVGDKQLEKCVSGFDSWDICDQCCMNLFDKHSKAYEIALKWAYREEEYVRRAGFALMASLAVHDKKSGNKKFEQFLPIIVRFSTDERNFVKKAVNWALRQIGKRNIRLNKTAVETTQLILKRHPNSACARWIARDALRELTNQKVLERIRKKS